MSEQESDRLRRALRAIVQLREQLAQEQSRASEPIAVVSMACRCPGGVTTPEELWTMLDEGRDVITEIPKSRFDVDPIFDPDVEAIGKTYTRWGGFVGDIDGLDAGFFGMSPREARTVDPQERVLLETAWQLFERVGMVPEQLMGTPTGVYVGVSGSEYLAAAGGQDLNSVDGYSLLGTAHSAMVGRLSYWLGLQGPNFPVDTACSSSLVALHVACQGLRNGDCDLAVAGGVNLMLSSWAYVYFCRLRAMSPTGRCHSFSKDADGYVRAEACGLVLLKRLSDAQRDGDEILALIRGTALNQDGRSNGFTAPNGPAQQDVIRRALGVANLPPSSIDYVECHGTGTSLGDPIEVQALAAVYGEDRDPDHPIVIGSIKSNMGHAESAAGIGSVLKAILSLQHRRIPKTLHVNEPNPHIPWDDLPVHLAREPVEWQAGDTPRRVGVSSFGFSGTNGHVVLEEAPPVSEFVTAALPSGRAPLLLSGKSPAALKEQATRWAAWLAERDQMAFGDVLYTAAAGRAHFEYRACIFTDTAADAVEKLNALAQESSHRDVLVSERIKQKQVAFLFTGQGSQAVGMGRELDQAYPAFSAALDAACEACDPHLDRPLRSVLFAEEGSAEATLLDQTQWTQPALFAVETALFRLWVSLGVKPDLLLGHSIGELVAAHVGGVLSLADAARLVCARGRLMQACHSGGAMTSLQASEEEVRPHLVDQGEAVCIAALNGPRQTVISGDADGVALVAARLRAEGKKTSDLSVSHAFHSAHMDSMLGEFEDIAASCSFRGPRIPIVSNVTGKVASDAELRDPHYWCRQVRSAVRFTEGIQALHAEGASVFVECGPRGVLCAMGAASIPRDGVAFIPSLRQGRDEVQTYNRALGRVHVEGADVKWAQVVSGVGQLCNTLPTYPFQRKRYWIEGGSSAYVSTPTPPPTPKAGAVVEVVLNSESQPWLQRHRLGSSLVVSSTMLLDLIASAAHQQLGLAEVAVENLRFERPLELVEGQDKALRIEIIAAGGGHQATCSTVDASGASTVVARATIAPEAPPPGEGTLVDARARCTTSLEVSALLSKARARGYTLACFDHLHSAWQGEDELVLKVSVPTSAEPLQGWSQLREVADVIPFVGGAILGEGDDLAVPILFGRSALHGDPGNTLWVHARRRDGTTTVALFGDGGQPCGGVEDVRVQGVGAAPVAAPVVAPVAASPRDPIMESLCGDAETVVLAGHLSELEHASLQTLMGAPGREVVLYPVPACEAAAQTLKRVDAARVRVVQGEGALLQQAAGTAPPALVWLEPTHDHGEQRMQEYQSLWGLHLASVQWQSSRFSVLLPGARKGGSGAGQRFLDELARHRQDASLPYQNVWGEPVTPAVVATPPTPAAQAAPVARPSASSPRERERLFNLVRDALAAVLDCETHEIDPDALFSEMGFDSLVGVEFRNKINEGTGLELSAAMAYDYPTPAALVDHLVTLLGSSAPVAPAPVAPLSSPASSSAPPAASPPAVQSTERLFTIVQESLAAVLDCETHEIDPDALFSEMGFDSLVGVEFRNRINERTGLELSAAMAYDYPTPASLVKHLATLLGEQAPAAPAPVAPLSSPAPESPTPVARGEVTGHQEPIAVVAMACRLPGGVDSPEAYWSLLEEGGDVVGPFPERWERYALYDPDPDAVGKSTTVRGGFLEHAEDFDAGFFGIAPREALAMDPQQRVVLEVAWEALERAGVVPASLEQSATGVFIGSTGSDYGVNALEELSGYEGTGSLLSVISGRVAYALGLHGPALTVDTACSSSLVALDLACTALRRDDCTMALAGGVQVMSTPATFVEFSRLRGLAADGRCKAFGAGADGTGWAEGAGILVLKRLSRAQEDGDEVLAVITGSAVNQDGRSQGLTAPNGPSQARLIRQALTRGGVAPNDIDYVETHGTGTTLGDPIEAGALQDVFGPTRSPDAPLILSASKSNIGHSQGAAGVVAVMKAVLNLRHEVISRTLHADVPSEHIKWEGSGLALAREPVPWPALEGHVRRVGVSAFGLSGTNAHMILEEAPPAVEQAGSAAVPFDFPLLVSGREPGAIRAQAERWASWCRRHPGVAWGDVVATAALGRTHLPARLAVYAEGAAEAAEALSAFAFGQPHPALRRGKGGGGGLALLFTGQGSQVPGMGKELYAGHPVFKAALDDVCAQVDRHLDLSLRALLFASPGSGEAALLHETRYTQAALFALEVALFRLWAAWGVSPTRLLGHSIGELVAAHVSGVLSLPDAARLVCARGRLMQGCRSDGAMVSLEATEEEVRAMLADSPGVAIAGLNGPRQTVISGDEGAVVQIAAGLADQGRRTTRLEVSHAFHSPHMEEMLEAFKAEAATCTFHPPQIPIISNLTGERASDEQLMSPQYWTDLVRSAVRFSDGIKALRAEGITTFLECGPGGVLSAMGAGCVADDDAMTFIPSMRKGRDEITTLTTALGDVHLAGHSVRWSAVLEGVLPHVVPLPTYAFQRERFWKDDTPQGSSATLGSVADVELWDAVKRGDAAELAALLGVSGEANALVASVLPHLDAFRELRDARGSLTQWLYGERWKRSDPGMSTDTPGTWLVVAPEEAEATAALLTSSLEGRGVKVVRWEAAVDRASLVERVQGVEGELQGVLCLSAWAQEALADHPHLPSGLAQSVALVQALGDAGTTAPLWLLTQGAAKVEPDDVVSAPLQNLSWGLGRVVGLEHPERFGGVVDLPKSLNEKVLAALWSSLGARDDEDQIALRASGRWVRRVGRAPASPASETWCPQGAVLITGGTGALGAHTARWLVAQGATHCILTSRRGEQAPGADALRAELEAQGATVTIVACDVSSESEVRALVETLDAASTDLRAVVHTAGVSEYVPLSELDSDVLERGLAAKVSGAWHLHRHLSHYDLDRFVLYSSIAGLWGAGQQAPYCAANSALDGLAAHRQGQGLPATVISWGPWAGEGMVEAANALVHGEAQLLKRGLRPMSAVVALAGLELALRTPAPTVAVVDVDWSRFAPSFASMRARPLLADIAEAREAMGQRASVDDVGSLRDTLLALPTDERPGATLALVQEEIAAVLGIKSAALVDPDEALESLGLDSLMAVQLRDRFSVLTDTALPTTLAFDFPTPRELAEHFTSLLGGDDGAEAVAAPEPIDDGGPDVESMDTDELLALLEEKYGEEGDA